MLSSTQPSAEEHSDLRLSLAPAKWIVLFALTTSVFDLARSLLSLPWSASYLMVWVTRAHGFSEVLTIISSAFMGVGAILCLQRRGHGPRWMAWGGLGIVLAQLVWLCGILLSLYHGHAFYSPMRDAWYDATFAFWDAALPAAVCIIAFRQKNDVFLAGVADG